LPGHIEDSRQSSWKLEKTMQTQVHDGMAVTAPIPTALAEPLEKFKLPVWDLEHLRLAIAAAGVALWSWNVDTNTITMDERAFEIRWISARGQGNDADIVGRIMHGIFIDVTGRKQAEEGHELLAGEMSHRVKNLLAIATGLTAITSRSAKTTADMAQELTHRLTALGRAHDLVRPLPGQEGKAALLGDLITVLLAPYDDMSAFSARVRVSVPRMGVGEQAATTLALVVHELATNSLKYGALSSPTGTLDISCAPHDTDVVVVWTERGGPPVAAPAGEGGYGSKLLNRGMTVQLGGSITCDWSAEGVIVSLQMSKDRLTR
jgi:two-component sensor histidine kinase